MSGALNAVGGLTQAWTSVYTLGLGAAVKEGRRAEIASDLWDQQSGASISGEPSIITARHIVARCVLGIAADLAWRVEAGLAPNQERKGQMAESWTSRLGLLAGIGFALLPIVFGAGFIAGGGDSTVDKVIWGGLWILTGAAIVAGLLLIRRTYGRGMALVAIGVIAFCLSTFWMAFITVPVGIALLVLAHLRGRGVPSPRTTGTA